MAEEMPTLDDRAIADARDHFLASDDTADPQVRRMILASWKRSRENNVGIDRLRIPYVRDPDLEAPLCRSAAPILDALGRQLSGESVSIILTDQTGLVLDRRGCGSEITQNLDDISLAPGFSYAEQFAGTNGIGTAISSGRATLVDGGEHYAQELGRFACAGVPIKHPTRGKTLGVLDLTAWSQAPGAMLMALATATARQIEEELLAQTGLRELALFQEYVRTCQQSAGPVLALNNDVVMTNDQLRLVLDAGEQQALIGYAMDAMRGADRESVRTVELPSGRSARLRFMPARIDSAPAGGVFRVRLADAAAAGRPRSGAATRARATITLPGLVGHGAAWTRCVQQVDSCYQAGDWVAIEGEPGVGKRALLRAVHQLHKPGGHFRVMEAPDKQDFDAWHSSLAHELSIPDAMIVLARTDRLDEKQTAAVSALLVEAAASPAEHARVAITITAGAPSDLRASFPRSVEVPPLRHHIDDLSELVGHLLAELPNGDRLTCSPKALAQLCRLNWPGNVAQLRRVLHYVIQHRRTGIIEIEDLPAECRSASRRVLSPIEALERDAIVNALIDNGGNATAAAMLLGMSRATIYRKIRQYGIMLSLAR
ncbi:MAG: sigma-54 dependent transcriptional regulator, acetoin dehydrogenase operon transcriptional [Pseudonocardiales bacterium]|nr:sigma-54 dependent transcriptional regulator, acetoin dehydrogenase operon transcriptional [Pseudonocardiales bacterium]